MTDRTSRATIARATLESIAYQVDEVLHCMEADSRSRVRKLRVDGGPTANRFLMQFQADISNVRVEVPEISEVTMRGTALLAGLGVNFWSDPLEIITSAKKTIYKPRMRSNERVPLLSAWRKAVARSRRWDM
jgi:glycerol kinase